MPCLRERQLLWVTYGQIRYQYRYLEQTFHLLLVRHEPQRSQSMTYCEATVAYLSVIRKHIEFHCNKFLYWQQHFRRKTIQGYFLPFLHKCMTGWVHFFQWRGAVWTHSQQQEPSASVWESIGWSFWEKSSFLPSHRSWNCWGSCVYLPFRTFV